MQKLNQGSLPKKGCNFFRGSFFAKRPDERSDFGSTFLLAPTSEADLGGEAKSKSEMKNSVSKN